MKQYKYYAGIDISKKTLDITVIDQNKKKLIYLQVTNSQKGIKQILKKCKNEKIDLYKTLFCCENTGIYTTILSKVLQENKIDIWVENPHAINKSKGITRGKNDIIDSYRISTYALRFRDKSVLWKPNSESLEKLKQFFMLRDRILENITRLKTPLNESKNFIDKKFHTQLKKAISKSIRSLEEDLKRVERELEIVIKEDKELEKNYDLAKSVPCIGKMTSMYLLMCTNNYSKIKTYKQGACYAGIAPFEYRSGTSIRGKTRVSNMANKHLKKLLHIGSLSVLKHKKGELYKYFERKKIEGKHIMVVLNALRNKILNRVFACVNKGQLYDPGYVNTIN